MRQSIVPVLLLAAVALSSSNVLPMMSTNQLESEIAVEGQQNDNILSSRLNSRDMLNKEFYNILFRLPQRNTLLRQVEKFNKNSRAQTIVNNVLNDNDYYDGEGFRKKQWHNYPRQLDRLQKFLFAWHKTDKRTPETDDLDNPEGDDSTASSDRIDDNISTNEYFLHSDGRQNIYDAVVAATNPLLILKIHLACLDKGIKHSLTTEDEQFQVEPKFVSENNIEDENKFSNKIHLATKVKREDDISSVADNSGSKKTKRLFSLWSRLQALSHKGHELPTRRHLAYYSYPDEESGGSAGTLSSPQTRATFVRPPGSPLRWG